MTSRTRFLLALFLTAATPAASANDGFGGLSASGLEFRQAKDVRMLSEDLSIGLKTIKVAYVFRHEGSTDTTGEIIFPLPPISLAALNTSDFAIAREDLDKPNFVNFTARVDGRAVAVKTDRIAVLEPPYDENRKAAAAYETPGQDVTAILQRYSIPLSLDLEALDAALKRLPQAARDDLKAKGLAEFDDTDGSVYPMWSIVERYHWTQTFKAGRDVKIEHSYLSAPPGGIFGWQGDGGDYEKLLTAKYCIDAGTASAIKKALTPSEDGSYATGIAHYVDYVLTTANTWSGPIGEFRLTIDKGDAKNVLSLCIDGIRKTGPTTFVVEKKNFTPQRELNLLIVSGMPQP